MAIKYPANIDNSISIPIVVDSITNIDSKLLNTYRSAILAIENELGIKPSGPSDTVRSRLDGTDVILTNILNSLDLSGVFVAGGDLSGTPTNQTVIAIRGVNVSATSPTDGYVLTYDTGTSSWVPAASQSAFVGAGDLTGNGLSQTVVGIQGRDVSNSAPSDGYYLQWNQLSNQWEPSEAPSGTFSAGGDLSGSSSNQTVIALQGNSVLSQILGASNDGYVLTWNNGASRWEASYIPNQFTAGGDLTGSDVSQTVIALQGNSVLAQSLGASDDGYVLTWNDTSSRWEALPTAPTFTASGDLSGTNSNQTVVALQSNSVLAQSLSAINDGYVLTWNDGSSRWEALPAPDSFTAGGDLSGTSSSQTVNRLKGKDLNSSLSTIGATEDGYVLTWDNGTSSWKSLPSSTAAGGSANELQYNNGGVLGGMQKFTYSSDALSVASGGKIDLVGAGALADAPIRFPDPAGAKYLIKGHSGVSSDASILYQNGGTITFGDSSNLSLNLNAVTLTLLSRSGDGVIYQGTGSTRVASWRSGGFQFGPGNVDLGAGNGVIGIDNATTNPSINPTSGIVLYVDGGDGYLKYRSASGQTINLNGSGSGGVPGGSDTYVQFNDGGSFGGDAGLTYNKTTNTLFTSGNLIQSDGYVSLAGNSASSISTSSGALTLTSAAAATWSTAAGDLTLKSDVGNLVLNGSSSINLYNGADYAVAIDTSGLSFDGTTDKYLAIETSPNYGANLFISSGDAGGTGGDGGYLSISAGTAANGNHNGGDVYIKSGDASGSGYDGALYFTAGQGTSKELLQLIPAGYYGATVGKFVSVNGQFTNSGILDASNGSGVMIMIDAVSAPTTGYTGAALVYSESGILKTIDPSGNVNAFSSATISTGGLITLAGDLNGTGTSASSPKVGQLTGVSGTLSLATTAATISWASGTSSPTLKQSDVATNSATGATLTIQSQNATGTTSTGGNLILTSGAGTSTDGYINLQVGGTDVARCIEDKFITSSGRRLKTTLVNNTDYNVLSSDDIIIITNLSATRTITLPSSPVSGDNYTVKDQSAQATTYPISVSGNGNNIDGSASYSIDVDYAAVMFVFANNVWNVL
jgi:hypothetical protein